MPMSVTSFAMRCRWHMRALGRNPLVRTSDRLEAFSVLAVLLMALLVIPVAAAAGRVTYESSMNTVREQTSSRHSVEAVALDGSTTMPVDFNGPAPLRVQWRDGSHTRTQDIFTAATVRKGAEVTVWLDDAGKVVAEPLQADDATLSAAVAELSVWVSLVAFGAFCAYVVRRSLDGYRARAWEREIQLMAHNDDGWANRHP